MLAAGRAAGAQVVGAGLAAFDQHVVAAGGARSPIGVDLHDLLRVPVADRTSARVALRDRRRQQSADPGEQRPDLACLAVKRRPVTRVQRRRLVAVGEEHQRRLVRQRPRQGQAGVIGLRHLAVAAPGHRGVDAFDRMHDLGPVGADLHRRIQQHHAVRCEHRCADRGTAWQRLDDAERRPLGELEPRPRPAVDRHVLDQHALRDVESHHDTDAGLGRRRRIPVPRSVGERQAGDREQQPARLHGRPSDVPRMVVGARSAFSGCAGISSTASGSSSGSSRTARSRL